MAEEVNLSEAPEGANLVTVDAALYGAEVYAIEWDPGRPTPNQARMALRDVAQRLIDLEALVTRLQSEKKALTRQLQEDTGPHA